MLGALHFLNQQAFYRHPQKSMYARRLSNVQQVLKKSTGNENFEFSTQRLLHESLKFMHQQVITELVELSHKSLYTWRLFSQCFSETCTLRFSLFLMH